MVVFDPLYNYVITQLQFCTYISIHVFLPSFNSSLQYAIFVKNFYFSKNFCEMICRWCISLKTLGSQ